MIFHCSKKVNISYHPVGIFLYCQTCRHQYQQLSKTAFVCNDKATIVYQAMMGSCNNFKRRMPLNVCISQEFERPLLTPATKASVRRGQLDWPTPPLASSPSGSASPITAYTKSRGTFSPCNSRTLVVVAR